MNREAERIVGMYQRHAAVWDQMRSPGSLFEKPWLDRFLELVPAGRGPRAAGEAARILDVGCGAGLPISGYFIRQGYRVTGVDTSGPLLEVARGRFPEQEWILGDMRTMELGRRFDGVLAWHSFFHLTPEDQTAMFPVFGRHAAPGAPLMFTSGPEHGSVLGDFEGEPLYHGSLDPEEYRALLAENGFEEIAFAVEDHATIWLARKEREAGKSGTQEYSSGG